MLGRGGGETVGLYISLGLREGKGGNGKRMGRDGESVPTPKVR